MGDENKTKAELIEELQELRRRVRALEALESERRRVEEALRESEERFRFMAETTGDALYRLRYSSMLYDYLSPSIEKLTGYTADEINFMGFSALVLHIETVDKTDLSMAAIAQERQEGKTGEYHADYLIRTRQGERRWLGDHSFPWSDEAGNIVGSVGILSDITERKQVEDTLREMNQELKRLATLDGLTQVANRRRFDEFISQEWFRLRREQAPLSLILCDIDHFKLYNDTYGHQAGDDCLRQVAKTISRNVCRPADLVARYGGEEFAIILPHTDSTGAAHVAGAIRKDLQGQGIAHAHSSTGNLLTMSFGISSLIPHLASSPEGLIALADAGLYEAKRLGRDRIIIKTARPESCPVAFPVR